MEKNGHDDPRQGKTSASSALYDELCPGRHQAQKAARELLGERATKDSLFGDAIHQALALSDPAGLDSEALKTFELCRMVEATILESYFGPDALEAQKKCWRHKRLWGNFNGYDHSGELDVFYRFRDKGLVIEYKTLFGEVEASPQNHQLRDQAVLAWKHYLGLAEIAVAVDQPHVSLNANICVYDKVALLHSEEDMVKRITASNDPNAARVAGQVQCNFCAAKTLCKEYAAWMAPRVPIPASGPLFEKAMSTWTPQDWVTFCDVLEVAGKWFKLGRDEAKRRLKSDPNSIPGYYLKEGNKVRSVVDPNALYGRFEKLGGNLEQFMRCVEIGLGKLEEQLRGVTGAKGKGLDKAMDTILKDLVAVNENEPSIARKKE